MTDTVAGSDLAKGPAEYLLRTGDGRILVEPAEDELFIDIDSEEDHDRCYAMLAMFATNGFGAKVIRDTPSRDEGHRHIVVRLDWKVDRISRIAFQACLGSDRKRELLSIFRVLLGQDVATVFFEEASIGEAETAR